MDDQQGLLRFLAYTVLLSLTAVGLCTSLLAFTLSTGDLPFGMRPLMRVPEAQPQKLVEQNKKQDQLKRQQRGALYAQRLYSALEEQRQGLAVKESNLKEQRRELEEYRRSVLELDEKLQEREKRIEKLLEYTDEAEKKNINRLSSILSEADPVAGARILMDVPTKTAARILKGMDSRRSSEMVNALAQLNGGDISKVTRMLSSIQEMSSAESPPTKAAN